MLFLSNLKMTSTKLTIIAVVANFVLLDAHLCMWQPLQRNGAFEIVEPGQSACYLKEGKTGRIPPKSF